LARKIDRLKAGEPPRFLDLFAGCGGISLGFVSAGYELVESAEIDKWAAASHAATFAKAFRGNATLALAKARDVAVVGPESLFRDYGLAGDADGHVDVLVAGPPCQAFSRVGRAKLCHEALRRDGENAQIAHLVDGRASLWEWYLYYVRETRPLVLLFENVPDILNHGGKNVAGEIAWELRRLGYDVSYTLLNASWYGVPQTRERMFLIGVHCCLGGGAVFPAPTHYAALSSGYASFRAGVLKLVSGTGLGNRLFAMGTDDRGRGYFRVRDPSPEDGLPPATTAGEALGDLPPIYALDLLGKGQISKGRKDPSEKVGYVTGEPATAWARLMRRWPGFGTEGETTGHVIRYLPRDYKFFRLMGEGWSYPDIWRFVEGERGRLLAGLGDARARLEIARDWTLPYDPGKFPNKWGKLCRDRQALTLMAHLGKDSYSHVHYDSEQARTISVREAARLQSFPDGFVFRGSMGHAFRQIGNAVPPLLAYAIAMALRPVLGCRDVPDMREGLLGLSRDALSRTVKAPSERIGFVG
jgi:DNA (cytosine-5)-methyltransferase 1